MKPMKDIPVYDIVMKDGEDSGMYRISLVTNPAIQENFIVNSISDAKIYDGYMYGKFEIIFVD